LSVLIGVAVLFLGAGFFTRQAAGLRDHAWSGPRTKGQRQRGAQAQRPLRHEVRLIRENARWANWLEQQRHDRKNPPPPRERRPAALLRFAGWAGRTARRRGRESYAELRERYIRNRAPAGGQIPAGPPPPEPPAQPPQRPPGAPQRVNGTPGGNTVTANGNAVEQFVEGVNQIHATAQAGGIHAKHAGIMASHEGSVRFAAMATMLARQMSEPGMNYGPEITEPIAKAGTHLQAAAMAWSEADAALAALMNMTVGDLANSSRQAPHHAELSENGSR
jgi:hypothetical protein